MAYIRPFVLSLALLEHRATTGGAFKVEQAGSCHKRQKPQAPIRNRQTRKVANAKGLNRNTNIT